MAYGYSQLNNSGYVQIDGIYKNLKVVQSGTLSGTGSSPGLVYFSSAISNPIIAIGNASINAYWRLEVQPSNYFSLIWGNYTDSGSVSYKIYDVPTGTLESGKHGMRIFNSLGERTFDSNYDYFSSKYIINGFTPNITVGTPTAIAHNLGAGHYVVGTSGIGHISMIDEYGGYDYPSQDNYYLYVNSYSANTMYLKEIGEYAGQLGNGQSGKTYYPNNTPIILGF